MPGPRVWLSVIEQLAVPARLVRPVRHDCVPIVMVMERPEIGVVPSSRSVAENVAGNPFAITVGLLVVNFVVVSSFVIVNGVEVLLPE